MQVIHLSQKELAERWRTSEATLEGWRSERVLYRLVDIETGKINKRIYRTKSNY